ncbi:unnamed protein product [Periconia digitata]|uniref:Uncharacterized protein n=1 Tax=Periconia digitata TaxID=1303443 RepID=A0A9W4UD78_9PLEO|nr:unnamed protein product [Periconia digitata]
MKYDNGASILATSVILEVIVLVCVGLRFHTRIWNKTSFIVSDWLLRAATIFATGLTVLQIYAGHPRDLTDSVVSMLMRCLHEGVYIKALAEPLNGSIEDQRAATGRLNKAKHIELAYLLMGMYVSSRSGLSSCLSVFYTGISFFAKVVFRHFLLVWMVILVVWTVAFVLAGLARMQGAPEGDIRNSADFPRPLR